MVADHFASSVRDSKLERLENKIESDLEKVSSKIDDVTEKFSELFNQRDTQHNRSNLEIELIKKEIEALKKEMSQLYTKLDEISKILIRGTTREDSIINKVNELQLAQKTLHEKSQNKMAVVAMIIALISALAGVGSVIVALVK